MNKPPKPAAVKIKTKQQDEATKKSRSPSVHKKSGVTNAAEKTLKITVSKKTSSRRPAEVTKTRGDTSRSRERAREVVRSENSQPKERGTDALAKVSTARTKTSSTYSSRASVSTMNSKTTPKEHLSSHLSSTNNSPRKSEWLKSSKGTMDVGAPRKEGVMPPPIAIVTKDESRERLKSSRTTRDGSVAQREKMKTEVLSHGVHDVGKDKHSRHRKDEEAKPKEGEQKKKRENQHEKMTQDGIVSQFIDTVLSSSRPRTAKASELRARTEEAQKVAKEVEEVPKSAVDSRPSTSRRSRRQNTFNLKDQETPNQTHDTTKENSKTSLAVSQSATTATTFAAEENYDDDFEDYESDFEDDEETTEVSKASDDITSVSASRESHLDRIEEPLKEGSEAAVLWKSEPSLEPPEKKKIKSSFSAYSLYNFAAAKKEEDKKKELGKVQQRAKDILELVTFDYVSISVFDLPPSSYDIYMKTFGRANTKQEITQTDNICEEECQTEDIDVIERWTQQPPHDYKGLGCGTSIGDPKPTSLEQDPDLQDFLRTTTPLMLQVIEEDLATQNQKTLQRCPPEMSFSRGKVVLDASFILETGKVKDMCVSPQSHNMLMTLHQPVAEDLRGDSALLDNGILCVWNLNKPSEPEEVLVSNALPTCCGWSPVGMGAVFAGMADGSIALWDLRGKYSLHKSLVVTSRWPHREWQLKLPSYSTASVLGEDNHSSQVVSVQSPVQNTSHSKKKLLLEEFSESTETFIILSLDEEGTIIVWTAVETRPDPAGSDNDLGIAPFGRWRLSRSSVIWLQKMLPAAAAGLDVLRATDMQVSPIQRTHIFIATSLGLVLHCARHGGRVSPKFFKSREEGTLAEANCIVFSPHNLPYFLVGCSDGSIRLHSTEYETSLKEWQSPTEGAVRSAQWSPSDPTKFFTASTDGHSLVVWDIWRSLPMTTIQWNEPRIVCLKSHGGHPAGTSDSYLVTATDNQEVDVYYFADSLQIADSAEYQKQRDTMLRL